MKKNKTNLSEHNYNHSLGKRIKFKIDQKDKAENAKQNENMHILKPTTRVPSLKINSQQNNIKDYSKEFKDKNVEKKIEEEKINENEELKNPVEDDEEDEYFNQPLMKVHRMSMRKKEMGKIRNNLKKSNVKKPESLDIVSIDRVKAQHMAQNFFSTRLKYFNQIRMNSESNDKNKSDYATTRPRRNFNNILSNNLEIKTDYSLDKNNIINKINNLISNKITNENKEENDNNYNNRDNINGIRHKFRRLPTDIYQDINLREKSFGEKDKYKESQNLKEKDKTIENQKIKEKEKQILKEEQELIEEKEKEKEEKKINKKEEMKKIKEMKKQIPIPIKKKEYRKKFRLLNLDRINNLLNNSNNISNSNYTEETNKTSQSINVLSSQTINVVTKPNLYSRHIGGVGRKIPTITLNKILKTETETENEKVEEKENLSSYRGYMRKYAKKENYEDPKLVYKSVIRVNKRIFENKENKKEVQKKKIKKFKETKGDDRIKTEENIRNRYRKKDKKEAENEPIKNEVIKVVKKDIKKEENNNNNNKTYNISFYRRRVFKKI